MTKEETQAMTLQLSKAISECRNAATRLEVLSNESHVTGFIKHNFRQWVKRLNSVQRDFRGMFTSENLKIVEKEMLNDEDTLQLEFITDVFLSLDKLSRDKVEAFMQDVSELTTKRD